MDRASYKVLSRAGICTHGRVYLNYMSGAPLIRGGNYELYDVKVFDGSDPYPGKLLRIISKKEMLAKEGER
jgi:hypothetical protein